MIRSSYEVQKLPSTKLQPLQLINPQGSPGVVLREKALRYILNRVPRQPHLLEVMKVVAFVISAGKKKFDS